MKLIQIKSNFHTVKLSERTQVYFSYETPIAFETPTKAFVSENIWSRTTGKHVNWCKENIPISAQIPNEEFVDELIITFGG